MNKTLTNAPGRFWGYQDSGIRFRLVLRKINDGLTGFIEEVEQRIWSDLKVGGGND